jgi:hypothetical protein
MATKLSDYLKNITNSDSFKNIANIVGSATNSLKTATGNLAGSVKNTAGAVMTPIKKTTQTVIKNAAGNTGKTTLTGGGSLKTTVKPAAASTAPKYSVSDAVKNLSAQTSVDGIRQRLDAFSKNKPADYVGSYQENISKLAEQIANRGEFSYDPTADGLWKLYEKKYTDLGKTAMADTIGKAAAMNSGYGTSYGQMAGQQAFNQYMQELADIIPELEQKAYDRWTDEERALLNQLAMYQGLDDKEYGRYRDEVGDYYTDLGFEKDLIDTERGIYESVRSFDYQVQQDAIINDLNEKKFKYQKKQDKIANDLAAEQWDYKKKQYDAEADSGEDNGYSITSSALTAAKKGAEKAFGNGESTLERVRSAVDYISNLPDEYAMYADEIANELGYPSYAQMIDFIESFGEKMDTSKSKADSFLWWKE